MELVRARSPVQSRSEKLHIVSLREPLEKRLWTFFLMRRLQRYATVSGVFSKLRFLHKQLLSGYEEYIIIMYNKKERENNDK